MSEGAVISTRKEVITFALGDDIYSTQEIFADDNDASPASETIYTLSSGANTITVPSGGSTVKPATIIPPDDNTESIILKGVTGDTGVTLSKLNPTTIAFETAPSTFVLTAGGTITGLRIIWS